jgi:cysteine synthase A
MVAEGRSGSVVTLIADSGDRYTDTYFSDEWLASAGLDPSTAADVLVEFERSGCWRTASPSLVRGPSEVRNSHSAARAKKPT